VRSPLASARLVREQDAPRSTGPGQVCAGIINAFVESASIGVKDPSDVMLTYGTTMGIAGVLNEPHLSREVSVNHADEGVRCTAFLG
jgi:hypothetical protein